MIRELSALSARLGAPPREATGELVEAFHLPVPPPWLTERDPLHTQIRERDALMLHGALALGSIFMANEVLWEPGDEDAPAGVVYTFDPVMQRFPDRLQRCGSRLFGFHESEREPPVDPWRRLLLDQLHSGYERPMHEPVPPELSQGHPAYHGSILVFREHLPGGHLTGLLVPLLVARHLEGHRPAMIVPSALWPDSLLAAWQPEDP